MIETMHVRRTETASAAAIGTQRQARGAGYAAGAWASVYGALWLYWTLGGKRGFSRCSALEFYQNQPCTAQPPNLVPGLAIVALCALGAMLAFVTVQSWGRTVPRWLPITVGWVATGWLLVFGPQTLMLDALRIVRVIPLPVDKAGTFDRALPFVGGLLVAAATLAYQRRTRGACERCGRTDAPATGIRPRWTTWAGVTAAIAPTWYLVMHLAWALNIRVGTSTDIVADQRAHPATLAVQTAVSVCVQLAASVLTLALIASWGERFPRWMPLLAGRKASRWLLLAPAFVVAAALVTYGGNAVLAMIRSLFGAALPGAEAGVASWIATVTYSSFAIWGVALAAAAIYHYQRTRGWCATCGRN